MNQRELDEYWRQQYEGMQAVSRPSWEPPTENLASDIAECERRTGLTDPTNWRRYRSRDYASPSWLKRQSLKGGSFADWCDREPITLKMALLGLACFAAACLLVRWLLG